METELAAPVSFAEWNAAINALQSGKAPGPSRVTSNMIRKWPPEVRMYAYRCVASIWENKDTPLWWKDHIQCLAPKKPDSVALSNMRPIGLYEIVRNDEESILLRKLST